MIRASFIYSTATGMMGFAGLLLVFIAHWS
jgi:hypothetical protein